MHGLISGLQNIDAIDLVIIYLAYGECYGLLLYNGAKQIALRLGQFFAIVEERVVEMMG